VISRPILFAFALSLVLAGSGSLIAGEEKGKPFSHADSGVSFVVPPSLAHDAKASREKPFSAVFTKGKPPFNTSVHYKQVSEKQSLEDWIKAEKVQAKKRGVEKELTWTPTKVGGHKAILLVRKSRFGEIHYLVFASPKNKRLYGFWHMTSKNADPKRECVAALQSMAKSLTFPKKK